MRLRFIFLTGPESAPVTYTPKSGPRALGDPQPGGGGGSCASSRLTRAPHQPNSEVGGGVGGGSSPCAQRPLLSVRLIKLRDSRPRTQEDSNSQSLQVGNSRVAGEAAVAHENWLRPPDSCAQQSPVLSGSRRPRSRESPQVSQLSRGARGPARSPGQPRSRASRAAGPERRRWAGRRGVLDLAPGHPRRRRLRLRCQIIHY